METTFITIHDLSSEAHILYCSDSIVDILGYSPHEVFGRSCWDFFHPQQLPLARARYGSGVELDKAAVLSYCLVKDNRGRWVGCEVIFTVVYDVLVGCTNIYRRGLRSENRARRAPVVRRLFSNPPQDSRYHMLSYLSSKFQDHSYSTLHEPRAALFLNRYTRTLTIMYATNGLADVLGISGEGLIGKSFYYCIEESCLKDAVQCLEDAKSNDSIAYLRFKFRDPRTDEHNEADASSSEDHGHAQMEDATDSGADDEGRTRTPVPASSRATVPDGSRWHSAPSVEISSESDNTPNGLESRTPSEDSSKTPGNYEQIFGEGRKGNSSVSSRSESSSLDPQQRQLRQALELEAVISCTSDGLVVCLRQARRLAAAATPATLAVPLASSSTGAVFASPWARTAETPIQTPQAQMESNAHLNLSKPVVDGYSTLAASSGAVSPHGQASSEVLRSIRECAVFAWGITSINGSLASFSRGLPHGEAQPPSGLPIWRGDLAETDNLHAEPENNHRPGPMPPRR